MCPWSVDIEDLLLFWSDPECVCHCFGLQRSIDVDALHHKLKQSRPQTRPWGWCSVIKVLSRKACQSSGLSVQKRQHKPLEGETHKARQSHWLDRDVVVENTLFPYNTTAVFLNGVCKSVRFLHISFLYLCADFQSHYTALIIFSMSFLNTPRSLSSNIALVQLSLLWKHLLHSP